MHVLQLDTELASHISPQHRQRAARELIAHLMTLEPGRWTPAQSLGDEKPLGLLLVEGLIARQVEVAGARCIELLSTGDLIRPWQEDAASFVDTRWVVLTQTSLALLNEEFSERVCRYPPLVDVLIGRAIQRSRSLAVHSAIDNVIGLRDSLELLFWHLAERWGTVDPDGVIMPLRLTHQMLADLVGARRPSVTAALRDLAEAGTLTRIDGRGWRLTGAPPAPTGPIS